MKKATVVFGALGVAAAGVAAWFFLFRKTLAERVLAVKKVVYDLAAANPRQTGRTRTFVWTDPALPVRVAALYPWAEGGGIGDPPGGKADAEAVVAAAEAEVSAGGPVVSFSGYSDDPLTGSYAGGGVLGLSRRNALDSAVDGGGYPGGGLLGLGRW